MTLHQKRFEIFQCHVQKSIGVRLRSIVSMFLSAFLTNKKVPQRHDVTVAVFLYKHQKFFFERGNSMQKNIATSTKIRQETLYKFNRKIGATNYVVSVNFSKTSRESINDKIMRLIRNDIQSGK
jgi:hypothetical protein